VRGGGRLVGAFDHAVAVAGGRAGPARRGLVVARQRTVAVLVAVHGGRNARYVGDDVLDLRLRDHLLALQDPAEQEPDDDQHDGDFDEREAFLCSFHWRSPLLPSSPGPMVSA
jgi:hypothetical protein